MLVVLISSYSRKCHCDQHFANAHFHKTTRRVMDVENFVETSVFIWLWRN